MYHSFVLPILLEVVKVFVADFTDRVCWLNAKVVDVRPGLLVAVLAHRVLAFMLVVQMLAELKYNTKCCFH